MLYLSIARYINLRKWFDKELSRVSDSMKVLIEDRRQQTFDRIDEVNERITELFHRLETEKAVIIQKIDDKGEELKEILSEFKVWQLYYRIVHEL